MTSDAAAHSADAFLSRRVALLRELRRERRSSISAGALGVVEGAAGDHPRVRFDDRESVEVPTDAIAPVRVLDGLPRGRELAVIFCAVVGSRAQGLAEDDSDTDRRGFYVPSAAMTFGLEAAPAQIVHDADQLCFWEVEKFVRLALAANPTVLETLFSPIVEFASPWAQRLLALREAVLSQRAYATFLGYADAQFDKMQRARDRDKAIKWAHAMHLIRLLHVGTHLVRTGRLDMMVATDRRDELLAIKRGEQSWAEVVDMRRRLKTQFEAAFQRTPLPAVPNVEAVSEYLIGLRLAVAREAD